MDHLLDQVEDRLLGLEQCRYMKTVHGILFEIYLKFLVWFWESQILLKELCYSAFSACWGQYRL